MDNAIPAGYWRDGEGRLIPENMVKPIDRARDDLVRELVGKAKAASAVLADFKAKAFGDIGAFVEMSGEQYGVKLGGVKGNVTLLSFDGRFKIVRQIQEHLVFDERLQAAKTLIDECINEWAKGSRPEIMVLVQQAFQTDKEGNLNVGRILALRRLEIADERWKAAMTAIGESVQVIGTKQYVRLYERVGDSGRYVPIALDMVAV